MQQAIEKLMVSEPPSRVEIQRLQQALQIMNARAGGKSALTGLANQVQKTPTPVHQDAEVRLILGCVESGQLRHAIAKLTNGLYAVGNLYVGQKIARSEQFDNIDLAFQR